MTGRANHRGWVVHESIPSEDGYHCIDLFEDGEGLVGFELLRADPEDAGRWTAVGGFGGKRFSNRASVAAAAVAAVPWIAPSEDARHGLDAWASASE